MKFFSVLCFVSVLSYASASTKSEAEVDKIMDKISSAVVGEMAKIAKVVHQGPNVTALELYSKLLETLRDNLKKMLSRIKELAALTHASVELISKRLSEKINENETLKKALLVDGKQSPRVIGAFIIGVAQIVTDVVNIAFRRY